MRRLLIVLLAGIGLSGCAEFHSYRQSLEDWAGEQIKIRDRFKQQFSEEATSTRDIDSLYVRIKKDFGFQTKEEAMQGCDSKTHTTCRWIEAAVTEYKIVHEKTPGVYYRMARVFDNREDEKQPFYVDVTLGKNGKKVDVEWSVKGSEAFANQVKEHMLKAIK